MLPAMPISSPARKSATIMRRVHVYACPLRCWASCAELDTAKKCFRLKPDPCRRVESMSWKAASKCWWQAAYRRCVKALRNLVAE